MENKRVIWSVALGGGLAALCLAAGLALSGVAAELPLAGLPGISTEMQSPGVSGPAAAGSAPVTEWGNPDSPSSTDQGVQVVNLGTFVHTQTRQDKPGAATPPSDEYITSLIVFSAPASAPAARLAPDVSKMFASDPTGARQPVSYTQLFAEDGLTIAAVTLRRAATRPGTMSLQIGAVGIGGSPVATSGQWRVGLVKQLVDNPVGGRLTGSFGMRPLPLRVNGATVSYQFPGGGPSGVVAAVTVDRPGTASRTIHVNLDKVTGQARSISPDEYARALQPPPGLPAPMVPRLPTGP